MHRILLPLVLVSLFSLLGCRSSDRPRPSEAGEVQTRLGPRASTLLDSALRQYIELKEALVMDQGPMASEAAGKLDQSLHRLQSHLDSLDLSSREEDSRLFLDTLIRANQEIRAQELDDLEWKRFYFAQVSEVLYRLYVLAEWEGVPLYQQYCPLAFNDHGGYWLSLDTEIRNPYFGRLLMECGEVIGQIP